VASVVSSSHVSLLMAAALSQPLKELPGNAHITWLTFWLSSRIANYVWFVFSALAFLLL
jgi:hypothetical protein